MKRDALNGAREWDGPCAPQCASCITPRLKRSIGVPTCKDCGHITCLNTPKATEAEPRA